MQEKAITACALLLTILPACLALKCFECKQTGMESNCSLQAENFVNTTINTVVCEPTANQTAEGMWAACTKDITTFIGHDGAQGKVARRGCDIVDFDDMCWDTDGGNTDTMQCVCSNADLCNSALPTFTHVSTALSLFAMLLATFTLM